MAELPQENTTAVPAARTGGLNFAPLPFFLLFRLM